MNALSELLREAVRDEQYAGVATTCSISKVVALEAADALEAALGRVARLEKQLNIVLTDARRYALVATDKAAGGL